MLHARHRPLSRSHHHPIDILADINGLVNGIALVPQLIELIRKGSFAGLSLSTFIITFSCNVVWHIYGWHRKAWPVVISSGLMVLTSGSIISFILLYRN